MKLGRAGYTFEKFSKDFQTLDKFLTRASARVKKGEWFEELKKISATYESRLIQVLNAGFRETDPNATPMLDYWTGGAELNDKPLPGEEKLFTSILEYLTKYYNVKPHNEMLDSLHSKASDNSTSIADQEVSYELTQLFTAFGHTSTQGMAAKRLEKLQKYSSEHKFNPDMKIMLEAIKFVAADESMPAHVIEEVTHALHNPFEEKGDRNVGTPYFSRTNSLIDNVKVEELVYNLSNSIYHKNISRPEDFAVKTAATPAVMFGRNSTKGVTGSWTGSKFKIKNFEASPRVIYGIPLVTNVQIARLYYSVMQGMKKLTSYSTLRGVNYLREMLPRLNQLDSKLGLYRISSDKSAYDTTISKELMICAALTDVLAFGHTEKNRHIIALALATDALTPIYYKTDLKSPIQLLYTNGGHKSGAYITLRWGSLIGKIIYTYSCMKLDRDWFLKTHRVYQSLNLPMAMFQGDDWSAVYKDREMALLAAKIEEEEFGLVNNIKKSAFGTWIVQMGCNTLGKVSYPLARALRAYYYPEKSSSQKPPFVLLMTAYSMIELLWDSPHLEYFIKEHLLKTDKYKGGLVNEKGKPMNFETFYEIFKKQAQDYGDKKIFNSNDPRWTDIVDANGKIKSDWIKKIWDKIKSLS